MHVLNGIAQDVINPDPLTLRQVDRVKIRRLQAEDRISISHLLERTPQFTPEERNCAVELVDIYIKQGKQSGYDFFVSVDSDNLLLGYICFGKIPLTDACYDIYWIVVDPAYHGRGIGTQLLDIVEEKLKCLGARKIFIETSSQQHYLPAQNFYEKRDFRLVSRIKDFYKIGDDKLVFVKEINPVPPI